MLDLIKELVKLHLPNLRLCITSRPEVDIWTALGPLTSTSNCVTLHDESGQKQDIVDYINSVVRSDTRMGLREEDKELIIQTLSDRADGMYELSSLLATPLILSDRFRWVSCQLETILLCFRQSLRQALEDLPETLDETYNRVLRDIPKVNQKHAHRLLQCLTVAVRPLRVQELAEVLAVDFGEAGAVPKLNEGWRCQWEDQEQAVLSACSSLITVVNDHNSRIVQFSHFSVLEFLTSDRLATAKMDASRYHHIQLEPAHAIMARVCISVLLCFKHRIDEENIKKFPLAQYAATHLAEHVEFANVISHITHGLDHLLDVDKPHFAAWMSYRSETWRWESHVGRLKGVPMYHIARLGLLGLVRYVIAKCPQDIVRIGGGYGTPLHAVLRGTAALPKDAALRRRRDKVFQLLLSHCERVDDIRDSDGRTPLHLAASDGRLDIAQMLIEHGSGVNAVDDAGLTPLHKSLVDEYTTLNEDKLNIVRLLLEHKADVDAPNKNGSTPLLLAADKGYLEVAELLLKSGASVNEPNKESRTPLHCASWGGYSDVIRILLEYGADVDGRDNDQATPLHLAARNGKIDAVLLLLQHGADANRLDGEGMTPIHRASSEGYADVIEALLENGADKDIWDDNHDTPLHLAAFSGKPEAVQLLLKHGATIDARNKVVQTPLHVASQIGHLDIIASLLDHAAGVDAQDVNHATPLHVAAGSRQLKAARLLLQQGAILDASNKDGETPLHVASRNGYVDIMRLLLKQGAATDAQSNTHVTPLHLAAQTGKLKAVLLVLHFQSTVSGTPLRDDYHDTPLHVAAYHGKFAVAKALLEHGAAVDVKNKFGRTPLHGAAMGGYREIAQLLLEYRADVGTEDSSSATPPYLVADNEMDDAAQMPSKHGAVHIRDNKGFTALHDAAWKGEADVVLLLLQYGADLEAQNSDDDTPLHLAACQGKLEATRALLEHARGAIVLLKNKLGRTPLHGAAMVANGNPDITRLLLEHQLPPRRSAVHIQDNQGWTPLHDASWNGYCDVVRLLLQYGADLKSKSGNNDTPLHLAARQGNLATAQVLLENGAIVHVQNESRETPLHSAVSGGHYDVAQLLIRHFTSVEAEHRNDGTRPHKAARNEDHDAVPVLLEHHVVHVRDNQGFTPLHEATWKGHHDVMLLLLEYGAHLEIRDNDGDTPLYLAAYQGDLEAIRVLLEHGAIANVQDKLGLTPLHAAVSSKYPDIARLLLMHGAAAGAQDNDHATPLHKAVQGGKLETVKILLEHGANVYVRDKTCQTPIGLALTGGNQEIIELVSEHAAYVFPLVSNSNSSKISFT